ncbi:hypothetical protein F3S47_08380 [Histidinibacterium aquaticum]|uniref:Hedgehog/Intein (Hint) domain-containing protein n=2 Tax=Histidinibacterium aquaticum TaxID=2613962 RepID=A0A5J5GPJ9_9RHOB|nr:hypothetical protein F3S47_08380 [Histidinibacterium aquaticum]
MKIRAGAFRVGRQGVVPEPAGLTPGTEILTLDGPMPVEHLLPGDRIITRDLGLCTLAGIHRQEAEVSPVRVAAGSIGYTRPDAPQVVGPGTVVHLRDWRAEAIFGRPTAQVPILKLADGEFVAPLPRRRMALLTLEFDAPHIVYAGGLQVVF